MKKYPMQLILFGGLLVLFTPAANAQWVRTNGPWSTVACQQCHNVTALAASGSNIFAGTNGGIFLSLDKGTNWAAVDSGLTNDSILSLAVNGSSVFSGTHGGGVFRSDNNGTNWSAVNSGLTNDTVLSLAVSGGSVFSGTHGGGVFRSDNNGTNWSAVDSGLTNASVLSLTVGGSAVVAGTNGGGIFRSVNNGAGWTAVNTGLTNDTVLSLAVSGGSVFSGTRGGGVFLSANNGTSWTAVNSGLTDTNVRALAVCGSTLFAGTHSGVWSRPLSEMIPVINHELPGEPQNPSAFKLTVPTRSNRNAAVSFSLPRSEPVTIAIYNSSGYEIATLVSKNLGSGSHSFYWDTRTMASGYYTVRIQGGLNTFVKSVLIFR